MISKIINTLKAAKDQRRSTSWYYRTVEENQGLGKQLAEHYKALALLPANEGDANDIGSLPASLNEARQAYENQAIMSVQRFTAMIEEPKRKLSEVAEKGVGSSRVDLQACKLEYSIVSPK